MHHIRNVFLRNQGLRHDPFLTAVAEYELYSKDELSHLFSYLVPLEILYSADSISTPAPSPLTNVVIFGPTGSGKTALRYKTEATYRATRNKTLVVSYTLDDTHQNVLLEAQQAQLVSSLAKDLFIQLIEQFNPTLLPVDLSMITAVSKLLNTSNAINSYIRNRISAITATEDSTELSKCWRWLSRPAVVSVPLSAPLRNLINRCFLDTPTRGTPNNRVALQEAMGVAKLWGFEHVLVTVDLGPNINHISAHTRAWIHTLLQLIESCYNLPISFRLFLPYSIRQNIKKTLSAIDAARPFSELFIAWNDPQLRAVLAQRFTASGIRGEGLYSLADDHLAPVLDDLVIEGANRSPRTMIELVKALLNAHLVNGSITSPIDRQAWRRLRSSWMEHLPPLPTPEIGTAI